MGFQPLPNPDAASVQELVAGIVWTGTIAATRSVPVFIAPFACRIVQASIMIWTVSVAVSDTNYWSVEVRRQRANTPAVIATKTTMATGGEAMAQRTDWNFDAATFSAANQLLSKGDACDFAWNKVGTATTVGDLVFMQVRYEPV